MSQKLSVADLLLITLEKTVEGYLQVEDFLYNQDSTAMVIQEKSRNLLYLKLSKD